MPYDDDDDCATQFDPNPWGGRQRVLPRRTFKAVASVVAPSPAPLPPAPIPVAPIVREADLPTWRVPKLALYPTSPRRQFDARLWLPIGGLAAIILIALVGAGLSGELRADATSISAALAGETTDYRILGVTNVDDPPVDAPAPAPVRHRAIVLATATHGSARHATKRPQLAVDVSTPLGDLVKHRR